MAHEEVAMRVLFTTTPGYGHLHPLIPFARALADAGHAVAVAAPAALAEAVAHTGFRHFPSGLDRDINDVFPQLRTWRGPDRVAFMGREVTGGLWPRQMIPDILALAATWPPDLIVRETSEYGGCIAAEALGVPHATVAIYVIGEFVPRDRLAAPLDAHRAAHGLPPDPNVVMRNRYLTLRPFPPGFQDPLLPVAPTTHYLRPMLGDRTGPEGLPPWVANLPAQPVVYVGLGTVFNEPAIFCAFIAGLRDESITLVVTDGRNQDPADYGEQPENVHIERYIPLSLLLAHCHLVVTNGGSGTLTAALAHGLPVVVVPVTADQPENAARCAALGLGTVVDPTGLTPEAARQAVLAALGDPAYRAAAERMRDEMAALPGPEYAVALLERLAVEKQPILSA
jgi:UDP:flavonoid glycosyltransferase YjiC (YdhE family)